ncbi:MAG TPA: uroporphyrinogen-III synthase [Chitinophagaceae bacterium]|jgi:uroporphyrinogen-III synthase|nr:uroporphyrinogen-III synthase [Chitinophagaceae bacterium]
MNKVVKKKESTVKTVEKTVSEKSKPSVAKTVKEVAKPKASAKSIASTKSVKTVLITQPRPESDKSPYFQLEKKYNIVLDFCPFILVEGVSAKDFRLQKVDITALTAVIFNSRNAIDHFFRICDELKIKISPEMKYFCITESIALYLQKFIVYRKRKIFYGLDGTVTSMLDVIAKHKSKEKYLVPVNDICRNEILDCLQKNKLEYTEVVLYKTVCNDVKSILDKAHDMIVFFTPGGVKSLFENQPKFSQNGTVLGAFGPITTKAAEDAGLNLDIKAPMPNAPSMVSAIDLFLSQFIKKK